MSTRVYWIIALAILIMAPLVVHFVTTALPVTQGEVPVTQNSQVAGSAAGADAAEAPPPPPPDMQASMASTDPTADVMPSLQADGIAPAAVDGSAQYVPPPPVTMASAPPPPPPPPADADAPSGPPKGPTPALPPPPQRPASSLQ